MEVPLGGLLGANMIRKDTDDLNVYEVHSKLIVSTERTRYTNQGTQVESIEIQPVLLAEFYDEKRVSLIIQAALIGKVAIFVPVPDPFHLKSILHIRLMPHQTHEVWQNKPNIICLTLRLYTGELHDINIGITGLIVDKLETDAFLNCGNKALKFQINCLSAKQVQERKDQIQNMSLDKRCKYIKARGNEIYAEIYSKYKDGKVSKLDVATLLLDEEKQIYVSLNQEIPSDKSYLKHLRTFKKIERSKIK